MRNSAKLPVASFVIAAFLVVFTIGSIAARSSNEHKAGAAGGGGDVANAPYAGSKFFSQAAAQSVGVDAVATGELKWDKAEYTAASGDVTFVVKNLATVAHQFGVEGNGIRYESGNLGGGTTATLTIKGLQPGEYQIVCNFPGHKEGGMVAKLTVTGDPVPGGGGAATPQGAATPGGRTGTPAPAASPTR